MYRCNRTDEDCHYCRDAVCRKPSDEKCSHSIWVDEGPEGFIQLPVGTGKAIEEIRFVAGGGKSMILESQSIGRSQRLKHPILRSSEVQGGIWEVFSEELTNCGLSRDEYHQANLIYFLNPNEKEPVFILKNRYGPTRYMGMEYLADAISKNRKMVLEQILMNNIGKEWSKIPRRFGLK